MTEQIVMADVIDQALRRTLQVEPGTAVALREKLRRGVRLLTATDDPANDELDFLGDIVEYVLATIAYHDPDKFLEMHEEFEIGLETLRDLPTVCPRKA